MPVDRKVVLTKNAPGPSPHNSQAIVSSGPFIFVSGQLGIDVQTGRFVQGSIENRVVSYPRSSPAVETIS
jgi:enamine deaminase RidA (YjgF/YER057c/UK114 family)